MPYIITDTCLNCGGCIDECPQDAIVDGEDNRRKIIQVKCNECGYCVEEFFCPGFAIEKTDK